MVIKTILDTDLYKFTTSYAYIKLFPYAIGTFTFKDRDETEYTEGFLEALKNEIHNLEMVKLTSEEQEYMTTHCRFLPSVYWEWLSSFRFDPNKIEVWLDEHHHLQMTVTDYLYKVTLYEVPLFGRDHRRTRHYLCHRHPHFQQHGGALHHPALFADVGVGGAGLTAL